MSLNFPHKTNKAMELEIEEVIGEAPAENIQKRVRQGRILLMISIVIFGMSYPLTVLFNSLGLNHLLPLYVTVTVGSILLLWGMVKVF